MKRRITALQKLLERLDTDALWITSLPKIRWSCGFSGSNGLLIVRNDAAHFLSDGRYATQAAQEVTAASVYAKGYDFLAGVAEQGLLEGCREIVYESDNLTVSALGELEKKMPNVRWRGEKELLVDMIASKDANEIQRIRAAQAITEEVFEDLLDWIQPGMSEKEVAAEIVYQHLLRGADRMAFEPIVASGPNSALPHARTSERTIKSGDVLLIDLGCEVDGYASDMTRTIAVGDVDPEAKDVYDTVLSAQLRAIDGARAGMASNQVDALARDVIEDRGYGDYFVHSLGHGVGLQVHEWPRLSYAVDYPLPRDAVVSIEPGIYLPDRFGIRIEDLIVLRDEGAEVLTTAAKEWTVI